MLGVCLFNKLMKKQARAIQLFFFPFLFFLMHLLFLTKSVNTLTLLEAAEKVHLYIFAFHEGEGEGEGTMN